MPPNLDSRLRRVMKFLKGSSGSDAHKGLIQSDVTVIFLIGPSGSGKTSIRKSATDDELAQPTDGISPNLYVQASECPALISLAPDNNSKFLFVEVPAYNADGENGVAIAQTRTWLSENWRTPKDVGVIYLHKISDPRINERPDVHLTEFRKICKGSKVHFPLKTIIMTMFWGEESDAELQSREKDLRAFVERHLKLTKPPVTLGEPRFCRFLGTSESIVAAVNQLFA